MMYVGSRGDLVTRDGQGKDQRVAGTPEKPNGVDFSYCSMKGVSFGNAKLDGANFTGALLQGANFKNCKLANVILKDAVLTGVDLKDLNVPPEALRDCVLEIAPQSLAKREEFRAKLDAHQRWVTTNGQQGALGSLDGEDVRSVSTLFTNRVLTGINMRRTLCVGIDFSGSQIQAAKFDGSDLRGADLSGVDLRGTTFKGANLLHANFDGADLRALRIGDGATLASDFSGATVNDDQLQDAIRDEIS
jgi:uncharacterized protein YjbI with pentapeptide repeats